MLACPRFCVVEERLHFGCVAVVGDPADGHEGVAYSQQGEVGTRGVHCGSGGRSTWSKKHCIFGLLCADLKDTCGSVDCQSRISVLKGLVGESPSYNYDRSKSGTAVTPPALWQLRPGVIPGLGPCVVPAHHRVVSTSSDCHEGGVVKREGTCTVQGVRQVRPLCPGGVSLEKHLACHVRVPTAKKVHVP